MSKKRKIIPKKNSIYKKIAIKASDLIGNEWAFMFAAFITLIWLISGPFFGYSDTWQLIINTSTSVLTFLIVFLIQNAQNRDSKMIQIKLDELLRCHSLAHNSILDLNKLSDKQLKQLERRYRELSDSDDKTPDKTE